MRARLASHAEALAGLERRGRLRRLQSAVGIDFTSNDYLGLATSPRLAEAVGAALARGVPVGAGGSRLLRGNHPEHEALEAEAAEFFGADRALYFATGHAANLAIFSSLPGPADLVVHDALIHASVHDGLARGRAVSIGARHGDVEAFETAITDWRRNSGRGRPWIAVESLYSMDGDRAPLDELMALADRHDGFLVVDEAHATGVHGPGGRGLSVALEGRENVLILHTCGKALGAAGALVCGHRVLHDVLVNRARSFIYSTAPSPLVAVAVREALRVLDDEPERRDALAGLVAFTERRLAERIGLAPSGSQILPIPIGDDAHAVRIAARMRAGGFDLRAIRPPTVPEGTARLRLSITLNVDEEAIARMVDLLAVTMAEVPA